MQTHIVSVGFTALTARKWPPSSGLLFSASREARLRLAFYAQLVANYSTAALPHFHLITAALPHMLFGMQAVVETPDYLADAKTADLTDDERTHIVELVSKDPTAGNPIVGTGGARKIRIAGRGKGKSGGYRVITFFAGDDIPVFLLAVFSKGDKVNLTKAERNELNDELAGLAKDYREGRKKILKTVKR